MASTTKAKRFIRVKGVRWFTNLDVKVYINFTTLYEHYAPEKYPKYDNYDVIEVIKTSEIQGDYSGIMGVPITFLDKYNPEQFEILGISGTDFADGVPECHMAWTTRNAQIDGRNIYRRIFIRRIEKEHDYNYTIIHHGWEANS